MIGHDTKWYKTIQVRLRTKCESKWKHLEDNDACPEPVQHWLGAVLAELFCWHFVHTARKLLQSALGPGSKADERNEERNEAKSEEEWKEYIYWIYGKRIGKGLAVKGQVKQQILERLLLQSSLKMLKDA